MVDRLKLASVLADLQPYGATLVAVSKTKPTDAIREAYELGQAAFGENYVQELTAKHNALPEAIHWHFIGHLQRNKVKQLVPFVSLIQSVDSPKLLGEINKAAALRNRRVRCLLQIHVATEETKFGFDATEAEALAASDQLGKLDHVSICGLMGMASLTSDQKQVRKEFKALKTLFDRLAPLLKDPGSGHPGKGILSMGMTADYHIALDEGSTMVRIGSALFGERA